MNNSEKALKAALRDACFNPRKPGSLTTIVTSNKVHYLVERAQEILRDSEQFIGAEKRARVRDAVSILAYAMTLLPTTAEVQAEIAKRLKDFPDETPHKDLC